MKTQIEWKKFKDEKPITQKQILYVTENKQFWFCGYIERPYDLDQKYNPDYYIFKNEKFRDGLAISSSDYWAEIKLPVLF